MQHTSIMTTNARVAKVCGDDALQLAVQGENVLVPSTGAKIRRIRGGLWKVMGYAESGKDTHNTVAILR